MNMRVMKHLFMGILLTGILLLSAGPGAAENDQELVARNLLRFLQSEKQIGSIAILEANALEPAAPKIPVACLATLEGGGYILVSLSRQQTPIKAYSLTSNFGNLPEAYRNGLLAEMEARQRLETAAAGIRKAESVPASVNVNAARWDFLLQVDTGRFPLSYTPDTYLLTSTWDQGPPYNNQTPLLENDQTHVLEQTVVGCTNVALGQIMRYYRYPARSKGWTTYTWNGEPLKAVLDRPYNWDNIPARLDAATPDYQVYEVASFLRDLGIANETDYDLDGSSTAMDMTALIWNYGYSRDLTQMTNSIENPFFETLKSEIDAERPVLLAFPGHMTVADGYAEGSEGNTVHVNMGWGGSADNFYYLDDPYEPINAGGYEFEIDPGKLTIYYPLKPCSGADCDTNLEAGDGIDGSGLQIAGNLDHAHDRDCYETYLKGASTISAFRGFGNIAFKIAFYDQTSQSRILLLDGWEAASPTAHSWNFPAGKYTVCTSFCESDSCFTYGGPYNYTVVLTTQALTPEEKTTIDGGVDQAPTIAGTLKDSLLNESATTPYRFLIDARDQNGDEVTLSIDNTNPAAVQASLTGNILEVLPAAGAAKTASKITVRATAGGKAAERSFVFLVDNQDVAFGKGYEVKGLFENQADFNLHRVILEGACIIGGYNGYSNQAFYSSVLSTGGAVQVPADDVEISGNFARTLYDLGASLMENPGGFGYQYDYEPDVNDRYTLSVSCPDADDGIAGIAGLLGIDLSGLEHPKGDINGDALLNLADAILALQVITRMNPQGIRSDYVSSGADIDGNGRIGLEEAIFIVQDLAGKR